MSKEKAIELGNRAQQLLDQAQEILSSGKDFAVKRAQQLNDEAEKLLAQAEAEENKGDD